MPTDPALTLSQMPERARKRAALHRAAAQLRHGWFRTSASSGWVNCPECRMPVTSAWHPWDTPYTIQRVLRDALTEHLLDEHTEAVTPS